MSGVAPIKPEYLIPVEYPAVDDDAAEQSTAHPSHSSSNHVSETVRAAGGRQKLTKAQKKAHRGMNKGNDRRNKRVRDQFELCWRTANGEQCDRGDQCSFSHNVKEYLESKPPDIPLRGDNSTIVCPGFEEFGQCRFGYKCRFLSAHTQRHEDNDVPSLLFDAKKQSESLAHKELNYVQPDFFKLLRSKKYPTPIATEYTTHLETMDSTKPQAIVLQEPDQDPDSSPAEKFRDSPDVPTRFLEKKRLHWKGKTYLAPLTTVGNLPFRRLCISYGADITCGEMALSSSLLQGSKEEWSLLRRHPSEKTFGIQIAGNKPSILTTVAEIIGKECSSGIDFVDLNCGCPIDLVFKSGSGSALLDMAGKLSKCVIGMNKALGDIPVTVKLRTGVKDGRNNAHKLMPRLASECGVACLTLHGRTRQQRYSKLADWDYIKTCIAAVREREEQDDLPQVPIFGGGDCFSSQEYWQRIDETGVDGVMMGRGALIKPWIFTEIKEHREWDISARERLDGIRQYAEWAISHFGSDTVGVNSARRYLCESLSFQYRYIPIGLLETLPGRINDRGPSAFRGRDDLETLLASGNSEDWVKISEMFLGRAPESWTFVPKHKSNSSEVAQG